MLDLSCLEARGGTILIRRSLPPFSDQKRAGRAGNGRRLHAAMEYKAVIPVRSGFKASGSLTSEISIERRSI